MAGPKTIAYLTPVNEARFYRLMQESLFMLNVKIVALSGLAGLFHKIANDRVYCTDADQLIAQAIGAASDDVTPVLVDLRNGILTVPRDNPDPNPDEPLISVVHRAWSPWNVKEWDRFYTRLQEFAQPYRSEIANFVGVMNTYQDVTMCLDPGGRTYNLGQAVENLNNIYRSFLSVFSEAHYEKILFDPLTHLEYEP